MARYRGTTDERGLGAAHVADKKRLRALHRDGDPCWRCGQPMYQWQELDRDHVIDRAMGGTDGPAVLSHASCNRAAGARAGNLSRPASPRQFGTGHETICKICGKPSWRAARSCEICGAHYHPSHGAQRSCSRPCGVVLRKRIYGPSQRSVPWPRKPRPAPKPPRERQWPPPVPVHYYTCRYCGTLGVTNGNLRQQREVCPDRACQLLRLTDNNWQRRKPNSRRSVIPQLASRQW